MLINLDLGPLQALKSLQIGSGISNKSQGSPGSPKNLRGQKCDSRISDFQRKKFGVDGRIGSSAPDQIEKSMQMELFPQPNDDFECAFLATPSMTAPWTLQ